MGAFRLSSCYDMSMKKFQAASKEYRRKLRAGEITRARVKNPWEKLAETPVSLRAAVNAKCAECQGWRKDETRMPGVVAAIRACTVEKCPLHSVRPYKPHSGDDE